MGTKLEQRAKKVERTNACVQLDVAKAAIKAEDYTGARAALLKVFGSVDTLDPQDVAANG